MVVKGVVIILFVAISPAGYMRQELQKPKPDNILTVYQRRTNQWVCQKIWSQSIPTGTIAKIVQVANMSQANTRIHLLETALELIWNSNYSEVGVNEICKQAGVTKGSFYHHFQSKAELFCEACNHHFDTVRKDLDTLLSPMHTPLEQLRGLLELLYKNKIGDDPEQLPGCPFFAATTQASCGEDLVVSTMRDMADHCGTYNLALINNLEKGGYLDGLVPAEQVARMMQHYIQGALNQARLTQDIDNLKRDLPVGLLRVIGLKSEYWPQILSP